MLDVVTTLSNRIDGTFPVGELRHDVAVDRNHVEKLKRSIQERGQIAPIIVWAAGNQIIDGFHRATALQELGIKEAAVTFVDCDKEEFQDLRITAGAIHEAVSLPRVARWVQEAFSETPWAAHLPASKVFAATQANRYNDGHFLGFSQEETQRLKAWVEAKASIWGLAPGTIGEMLKLGEVTTPLVGGGSSSTK